MASKSLNYVSFLQVVGPVLVIFGHAMNGLPHHWFLSPAKQFIYVFHMPLFFFIAGYLFSYKGGLANYNYWTFIEKKFLRLLLPYFVLNLLFILPKYIVSSFIVDQVELSLLYVFKILITPRMAIWGHLWFLFALFGLFLVSPLFSLLINKKNYYLYAITTGMLVYMYLNPIETELFALRDLSKDTLLFWVGILFGMLSLENIYRLIERNIHVVLWLFTAGLSILWFYNMDNTYIRLVLCVTIILSVFIIPIYFKINNSTITYLSNFSFGIYILHWPMMIILRIIFFQLLHLDGVSTFIIMFFGGFLGPLLFLNIVQGISEKLKSKWLYYLIGV